jgi:hypothetical protein
VCIFSTDAVTRFRRYPVLPALSMDGIIFGDIKTGSWNDDEFHKFFDGFLKNMNPFPGTRSVVVADKC